MWKFKNPVRHAIPDALWPAETEAANSFLFQPVTIGPTQAESRTWVPAMVPWRATNDGFVTQENLDWYRRFAKGRPGVLVVEATGVRDIPSGPLLRIGHDRFIPGLRQLVETVREASQGHTKLFIQIIDFLSVKRRPDRQKYFDRFLQITNRHREAVARILDADWQHLSDADIRNFLNSASEDVIAQVLNERELESLN
ncbi:MAG: NADH:flavin oxidoreductase, partial [Acidobacteria bacterium]|nr:NADH:flavin oxidoreductase [Acidobacteriota bacterium]